MNVQNPSFEKNEENWLQISMQFKWYGFPI